MTYTGITNLLMITGLIFIIYFSYNASREDGNINTMEFLKLAGILVLLSLFLSIFIGVAFFVIQSVSWILIYLLTIIKDGIFAMKTGCVASLALINAGGAYMVWEQIKEKKEEKKIRQEPASASQTESKVETKEDSTAEEHEKSHAKEDEKDDANGEIGAEYELSKEIGISQRISKILSEASIHTIEHLTSMTEKELSDTKNIGEKSVEEIKKTLEEKGLSLKQ